MMKATGLKRGSRKKQPQSQQPATDNDDPAQRPVTVAKQAQPAQVQQQPQPQATPLQPQENVPQRRRQNEEVAALTTKNYRLAKELADLRVRHRDECKNVTRLTMENMNLASRCREAISHVAMLKKELAMQQKRTASALASQREQTQRMADSLSNSMELSRLSRANSEEASDTKDENVVRLVTATPSPLRSKSLTGQSLSPASSKSTISSRPPSPPEEARDSPPADAGSGETTLEEDDTVDDTIAQVSRVSNSPTESVTETAKTKSFDDEESPPPSYSTPKKGEKWAPNLQDATARGRSDNGGLFPHSASPQVFSSKQKSYNEEFPSDIHQGKDDGSGAFPSVSSQQRKVNLLNSIDAFEKSFSVDFPDSFTPKESTRNSVENGRKMDIYNPFFSTPDRSATRSKRSNDSILPRDEEEKKINEPLRTFERDYKALNFETPPRVPRLKTSVSAGDPPRPEKTGSSAARERYEKALQPRQGAAEPNKSSDFHNSLSVLRRNQSNNADKEAEPKDTVTVNKVKSSTKSSVVDIVDAFEGNVELEDTADKVNRRFNFRRSVKQPISYAEPALNTKLRRGDKFFPKVEEEQPRIVTPRTVSP